MVISVARAGLVAAWRRPGLASLLWAWSLVLALPLTLPAWSWLHGATARAPESDILLQRFSFAAIADLLRADSPLALVVPALVATALVAIVGQALTAGGLIEVLITDDARPFLHRFFRGAGHFFWRFLRVGLYAWLACGVAASSVALAFAPIVSVLGEMTWEPAAHMARAARLPIVALLVLLIAVAFDYARIRVAREGSRHALLAFLRSLWFVVRHPRATLGLWFVMAAALAAIYAAYGAFRAYVPSDTWATILLMAAVQQLTILVAAGLRVALVAGEVAVWERYNPGGRPPVAGRTLQVAGSPPETNAPSRE